MRGHKLHRLAGSCFAFREAPRQLLISRLRLGSGQAWRRRLNNLCFEVVQLAEFGEVLFVVAVEEQLMESGEAEDGVAAVELYPYRYNASAGGRDIYVVQDGADRDEELGLAVLFFAAGQDIKTGDSLAYSPEGARHCVPIAVVMYYIERLRRAAETI